MSKVFCKQPGSKHCVMSYAVSDSAMELSSSHRQYLNGYVSVLSKKALLTKQRRARLVKWAIVFRPLADWNRHGNMNMNYENIEQRFHLWAENENIKELGKNSKGVLYLRLKLGEWPFWAGAQYGNYSHCFLHSLWFPSKQLLCWVAYERKVAGSSLQGRSTVKECQEGSGTVEQEHKEAPLATGC